MQKYLKLKKQLLELAVEIAKEETVVPLVREHKVEMTAAINKVIEFCDESVEFLTSMGPE